MARLLAAVLLLFAAPTRAARVVLVPRALPSAPRVAAVPRGLGLAVPAARLAPVPQASRLVFGAWHRPAPQAAAAVASPARARRELSARIARTAAFVARGRRAGGESRTLGRLFREDGSATGRDDAVFADAPVARPRIALPGYLAAREGTARTVPVPLSGGRFVRVGRSVIDTRAPHAKEVLDSLEALGDGAIVLGMFDSETARVLNAFAFGRGGVLAHKDAFGPLMDRKVVGGWTLLLQADGTVGFRESGGVYQPLTPMIKRRILAELGVRPADEGRLGALARRGLLLLDRLRLILTHGVFT